MSDGSGQAKRSAVTEEARTTRLRRTRRRQARLRLLFIGVVLLLVGLVAWQLTLPQPAGPAMGTRLEGHSIPATATTAPSGALRVATFNIHGGKDPSGQPDLDRIAAALRDYDVVGLNEVHHVEDGDQAKLLGAMLNVDSLFAPTERRFGHDDFGNAVLSTRPVRHWMRIPLAGTDGRGMRNVLHARVESGGEEGARVVNVLITHLDRQNDRETQLRGVIELFLSLESPVVLMGDLNTKAEDPQIATLLKRGDVTSALAGSAQAASNIDWILVRGMEVMAAGTSETGASDHPLLWAELKVRP